MGGATQGRGTSPCVFVMITNRGYIYTLVTITLVMILMSLVFFYFQVTKPRFTETVTAMRTDELHYFIEAVKKDFSRSASISGQRAATYAINDIISNYKPLEGYTFTPCSSFNYQVNGAEAAIAELMLCGTLYGQNSGSAAYMDDNTLYDWTDHIRKFGEDMGFIINMSLDDLKIRPFGAHNFAVLATFNTKAKDKDNISLYWGNISTLAIVPIYALEDPLYFNKTGEQDLVPSFKKCNRTDPVTPQEIDEWVNSTCYHTSETADAPSFFDRLDGKINRSTVYQKQANEMETIIGLPGVTDIGLEALANLDEFDAYRVPINSSYTWVDYLYWGKINGDCILPGTQHKNFRIDYDHALEYNLPLYCPYLKYTDSAIKLMMYLDNIPAIGENSTYAVDSSKYGNNGTIYGAVWTTDGKYGKALQFDGSNDYVSVENSPSLDLTNQVTLDAWVKTSGSNDYSGIIDKFNDLSNRGYSISLDTNGNVRSDFGNGNRYITAVYTGNVEDGAWHHIVGMYDGAVAKIYVDGTRGSSPGGTGFLVETTKKLIIGNDPDGGSSRFFNGVIDHVRVRNRSLKDSEIFDYFDDSLVLMMHLDNVSAIGETSTRTVDTSKYGNNGTVNGAVWTTNGRYGNALQFDGVDDYVNVLHSDSLNITRDFTLAAWINLTRNPDPVHGTGIISKGNGLNNGQYEMIVHPNGRITIRSTAGRQFSVSCNTLVNNLQNTWLHVVATFDSSYVNCYLNGASDGGGAVSNVAFPLNSTTNSLAIGVRELLAGSPSTAQFNGAIDEVLIFNRTLSALEVRSLYEGSVYKKIQDISM